MITYAFYAALNAIIMAGVLYYFDVRGSTLIKVAVTSFVLMTLRMHVQFEV